MVTFTPLDVVVCVVVCFTLGLYVGSFSQRRRDASEIRVLKTALRKLSVVLTNSNEKKEEEK